MSSPPAPDAHALEEGWYLMSVEDLELELARIRRPDTQTAPSGARKLSVREALAYRDAGNLPDEARRTLRLVLHVERVEPGALEARRLRFEPDFHDAPTWRIEGSAPINAIPIELGTRNAGDAAGPWWEEPEMKALEEEWRAGGRVAGIAVAAEYRSFVYKTIVSLRRAGKEVTPDSVASSIARWLPEEEVKRIRAAMEG